MSSSRYLSLLVINLQMDLSNYAKRSHHQRKTFQFLHYYLFSGHHLGSETRSSLVKVWIDVWYSLGWNAVLYIAIGARSHAKECHPIITANGWFPKMVRKRVSLCKWLEREIVHLITQSHVSNWKPVEVKRSLCIKLEKREFLFP